MQLFINNLLVFHNSITIESTLNILEENRDLPYIPKNAPKEKNKQKNNNITVFL